MTVPGKIEVGRCSSAVAWQTANKHVLWGWKRDEDRLSRAVYFSGDLERAARGSISLKRHHFSYFHRAPSAAIDYLQAAFEATRCYEDLEVRNSKCGGELSELRVAFGRATDVDRDHFRRLRLRRPRRRVENCLPDPNAQPESVRRWRRFDLYIGSGVSYEAGLPSLCDLHQVFSVDTQDRRSFAFGQNDSLPLRLGHSFAETLSQFCSVHTAAVVAAPTFAQRAIGTLQRQGVVGRVFTDNVDNMLARVGANFERTRGSGVFNERYPARFSSDVLVVIGVAADRRQIVQQARSQGRHIFVVNSCAEVSPRVRHLDYVRPYDSFVRCTAEIFFRRLTIGGT